MSKSYKVAKKTINMGEKKGQTLFSVRPYSYGTLTTEEVLTKSQWSLQLLLQT